jgi:hypothetical protein
VCASQKECRTHQWGLQSHPLLGLPQGNHFTVLKVVMIACPTEKVCELMTWMAFKGNVTGKLAMLLLVPLES